MNPTSELIKRLRQRGLSQSEISRRTGIPQPRLSRWESGAAGSGANDVLKLVRLDEQTTPPTPDVSAPPAAPEVQIARQEAA